MHQFGIVIGFGIWPQFRVHVVLQAYRQGRHVLNLFSLMSNAPRPLKFNLGPTYKLSYMECVSLRVGAVSYWGEGVHSVAGLDV